MVRTEATSKASVIHNKYIPAFSEHLLEVRYTPNPKILDYRGTWAEFVSKFMELPEWQITQDRIDIFDKEQTRRAFIGFRNAGFVIRNSPTPNYFPDQTRKLFKFIFDDLQGFGNKLFVERIGIRTRTLTSFSGNFEDLVENFTRGYLRMTPKASSLIDAELIDIGAPLNFKDKYGHFNTSSGPMTKAEMSQFFTFVADYEFPNVGLYIDVDYWERPEKELEGQIVLRKIRTLAEQGYLRYQQIASLILES